MMAFIDFVLNPQEPYLINAFGTYGVGNASGQLNLGRPYG